MQADSQDTIPSSPTSPAPPTRESPASSHLTAAPVPEQRESAPNSERADAAEQKDTEDRTFYKISYPGTGYVSCPSVVADIRDRLPDLPGWTVEELIEAPMNEQWVFDDGGFKLTGGHDITNNLQRILNAVAERKKYREYMAEKRRKRREKLEKWRSGNGDGVDSKEERVRQKEYEVEIVDDICGSR